MPHVHGPDCTDVITGSLVFVQVVDYVDWVKAIDRRTGMENQDYIAIPVQGIVADQQGHHTEDTAFTLLIRPDGARSIVNGIADLLEGPPPTTMHIPGSN